MLSNRESDVDTVSRLMMFLRALRYPTDQSEVNAELTRRQDAIERRLDRLAEAARRQDAVFRAHR